MINYIKTKYHAAKAWVSKTYDSVINWVKNTKDTIVTKMVDLGVTKQRLADALLVAAIANMLFFPLLGIVLLVLALYAYHKIFMSDKKAYRVRVILLSRKLRPVKAVLRDLMAVLMRRFMGISRNDELEHAAAVKEAKEAAANNKKKKN